MVELDLSLLELLLPRLQAKLVEGLDSIGCVGVDVQGSVDHSIGTYSKDTSQLQSPGEDLAESVFRRAESIECWRCWGSRQHNGVEGGWEVVLKGPLKASRTGIKAIREGVMTVSNRDPVEDSLRKRDSDVSRQERPGLHGFLRGEAGEDEATVDESLTSC